MTRLFKFLFSYITGFIFVAIFAPLFYLLVYSVVALLIPLALILLIPKTGAKEYREKPFSTRIEDLKETIQKSFGIIAAIAFLRAAAIIFYQHFPEAFSMIDLPLILATDFLGIESLAYHDFYLGILGVIVFIIICCEDTFWRLAQHRNILSMPYSKARSIAMGMVKIKGKVKPLQKYSHKTSLLEHFRNTEPHGSDHDFRIPFLLEDETGEIMIDTEGAKFATDTGAYGEQAGFAQYSQFFPEDYLGTILLPKHQKKRSAGSIMYRLRPGDIVYVLGIAQQRKADEDSDAKVIIRPNRGLYGHRHHDVFFLTNGMDMHPEKYFYNGLWHSWILTLVCLACIGWMIMNAQLGMIDYELAYGYNPQDVINKFYQKFN